jgi:hypothetical protein
MAKGGAREGAGRKPGVPNKRTVVAIEKAEASGLMPLDYMLAVLRDHQAPPEDRMEAARNAAPYVHAKLAPVDAKGDTARTVEVILVGPHGAISQA